MRRYLIQSGRWREWRALYGNARSVVIRVVLTSIHFNCLGIDTAGAHSIPKLGEAAQQLS